MKKEFKLLIFEIVLAIIVLVMFILMFNLNKDIGFAKFISVGNIMEEHNKVTSATTEYENVKNKYSSSLENLKKEKENYEFEKNKYLAITDETLNMIKEATADEKFDIEYMWITLGNYAKRNNLSIYLLEPGSIIDEKPEKDDDKKEDNKNSNGQISGNVNDKDKKPSNKDESNKPEKDDNKEVNNEFKIKVEGSYINLAEFVFNIENDKTLRFKLDKINMRLISGTTVEANFVVKNLKLVK